MQKSPSKHKSGHFSNSSNFPSVFQSMIARLLLLFVRFLLWYFDLRVRRKVTSSKPKCGLKWWINTHSHTPWRCRNQIRCGVLLSGDLLRIFSWLLLRLSESSQIHLIHPLTHSHTLHGLSKPSPRCTFPPPPAVTLIIYRSLIFHSSPLFNVPVPQSPSTLFLIPCSFRLLSSHSPFFYPMTPFFSTSLLSFRAQHASSLTTAAFCFIPLSAVEWNLFYSHLFITSILLLIPYIHFVPLSV